MSRRSTIALLALAFLAAAPAVAEITLVLEDGQEVVGSELEREDSLYLLTLPTGNVLPVPSELVAEVRFTEVPEIVEEEPLPEGFVRTEPRTLVGPPGGPAFPRRAEQLGVFGEPARFRSGTRDPTWVPTSDWSNDLSQNDFRPTRWYRAPIDSTWRPTSGFLRPGNAQFNPTRWYRAPIDPVWVPTDGFRGGATD